MKEKIRIIFPETQDERILQAMNILNIEGVCDTKRLEDFDDELSVDVLAQHYYEMRTAKGKTITLEEAKEKMKDRLYRAATLVSMGYVDAAIAGSMSPTSDVIRAGIQGVGLEEGIQTVSSFFLLTHNNKQIAFADCAVIENPTAAQLAEIAITTSDNYRKITTNIPHIAMLSHSTLGSAGGDSILKIREAIEIVKKRRPDLIIDGELQFDAAFDSIVANIKAPNSKVAGNANVFVFPDLSSGNISYKIAERMGGAEAIGPIIQGTKKPFMDLSRGCKVEDIVKLAKLISK
jgi:phosphate acetyltransferase